MARVAITPDNGDTDGVSIGAAASETTGDPVNHHEFVNTGQEVLIARNSGASPYDVTIEIGKLVDGQAVADKVLNIPAGESAIFGPFRTDVYNAPAAPTLAYCMVEDATVMLQVIRLV